MSDFISRRSFLKGGMTGAAGLAALGMLSGCSGSSQAAGGSGIIHGHGVAEVNSGQVMLPCTLAITSPAAICALSLRNSGVSTL